LLVNYKNPPEHDYGMHIGGGRSVRSGASKALIQWETQGCTRSERASPQTGARPSTPSRQRQRRRDWRISSCIWWWGNI